MRVPWTTRRLNQSILKEINPEYSLEGLMLRLKLKYYQSIIWDFKEQKKKNPLGAKSSWRIEFMEASPALEIKLM